MHLKCIWNRPIAIVPPAREALNTLLELPGYEPFGYVFRNKTGGQLRAATMSGYWAQVQARSGLDFDLYHATKHHGVWLMKTQLNLPNAVIAAQAGWSENSVDKMIATYGHAVDERRLDELLAADWDNPLPLPVEED